MKQFHLNKTRQMLKQVRLVLLGLLGLYNKVQLLLFLMVQSALFYPLLLFL
jgi:hypothetical protein